MAKYFASSPTQLEARIHNNLHILGMHFSRPGSGIVELRLLDRVFTTGYVIADPTSGNGHMIVQFYNYWIGVTNSPLFELFEREDQKWYSAYRRQFEIAWEHAEHYDYSNLKQELQTSTVYDD